MEVSVVFLNILKYQDKETKKDKYRFCYVLNDDKAKLENDKFKGLADNSFYFDNSKLFDILTKEDSLTSMKLVVENRPSKRNPLKSVMEVTKVITKNHGSIDLL